MNEPEFQIIRSVGFIVAVAAALVLQRLSPHARDGGSARTNLGLWGVNLVVMGAVCGVCACSVARWAAERDLGILNVSSAPPLVAVGVTVLALDLVSYLWHRANHQFASLWRFHRVHHSDDRFTVSTAVRFHPGELLLSLPLRLGGIILVGAPVAAVVIFEIAFTFANLVEHGDVDLPAWIEQRLAWICITPALHRRHHCRRVGNLQSNFGTIFTVWDRLLGTYGRSGSSQRFDIGVPGVRAPVGTLQALTLPFIPGVSLPRR
jgi:sterol desaturase/sphingolipid hydroxylase (fatty acid hydroxylase superfamily)